MDSKLITFLRSDSRFTRRTLPAVLREGFTVEAVIAEIKAAPGAFQIDIGIHGDIYLSAN
jgi:hypothetical protein